MPQPPQDINARFRPGQSAPRLEDRRFLTGTARYTADINVEGQLHAAIVRSDHAHAEILEIDITEAATMPGVVGVHTVADLDGDGTLEMVTAMWLGPLAGSTWTIQRRSLGIADAGRIAWGAYLGTNYDGVFVGR